MSEIVRRDERGRWLKGTRGGPGRPATRDPHRYIAILNDEMSDEEIRAAWRQQINKAVGGDTKAFELILDRAVGRATLAVDIQAEDPNSGRANLVAWLRYTSGEGPKPGGEEQEPEQLPSGTE